VAEEAGVKPVRALARIPPPYRLHREVASARRAFPLSEAPARRESMTEAINLAAKLASFDDHWSPRIVADFNGHDVMVVKVKGEFVWHDHQDTDDFVLVLSGKLRIDLPDGPVHLGPGELFVVPRGMQHRPVAEEEVHLLLIEPAGTPNTGDPATAAVKKRI
jgi:mannose-6-phosphate isomerase-like protein (cupin superfamily)